MANPLTLIMPLKAGADLKALQGLLTQQRGAIDAALKSIGSVHFARFVIFDASSANLQPSATSTGPFTLAVITSYDGDFNLYIQDFVNQIGLIFDVLLHFTADGAGLAPVKLHLKEFTAYVARNDASQQPPNSGMSLYSAYSSTVQEILSAVPSVPPSLV
jgi:hypothetical protein